MKAKVVSKNKPQLSFSKSFMYNVHQMYFLVQKHLEKKLLKSKTLSFSQFLVLVCFVDCRNTQDKNMQTQANVAKKMHLTEATVSRHIEKLKKLKFLVKKQDEHNKTKHIIELTQKGKTEFGKSQKIIEGELEEIFNVIKISDRKNIIQNFDKVLQKLSGINV